MRLLLIYILLFFIHDALATIWVKCDHDFIYKIDSDSAIIVEGIVASSSTDSCEAHYNVHEDRNLMVCPPTLYHVRIDEGSSYTTNNEDFLLYFYEGNEPGPWGGRYNEKLNRVHHGIRDTSGRLLGKRILYVSNSNSIKVDSLTNRKYIKHRIPFNKCSDRAVLLIEQNNFDFENDQNLQFWLDLYEVDREVNMRRKKRKIRSLLKYKDRFYDEKTGYIYFEKIVDENLKDLNVEDRLKLLHKHPLCPIK